MLSRLFIAALCSSVGKGLTSWLLLVMFNCDDKNNTNDPQKKYRLGRVGKNILLEGFQPVSRRKPHA